MLSALLFGGGGRALPHSASSEDRLAARWLEQLGGASVSLASVQGGGALLYQTKVTVETYRERAVEEA